MLEFVRTIKTVNGKADLRQQIISEFKRLFDHYPGTVSLYTTGGQYLYTNLRDHHELMLKKQGEHYNLLTDKTARYTCFINSFNRVRNGETITLRSKPEYSEFFPWYHQGEQHEITIYPLLDDLKKVIMVVIIHRQIQGIPQENDSCAQEIRKVEDQITYAFLNNISHELRTPLNWIIGFSELIANELSISKIKEFNRTINKGGVLLLTLVEKLMDASSIAKNDCALNTSQFDLNQMVNEVYGLIQSELETKDKKVTIKLNCKLNNGSTLIVTDKAKLKQILLNLLQNALKFTKKGYIELGLFITRENEYMFYIKDTGIGIEYKKQNYIFELFKKVEPNELMCQDGLGLGLSISKSYVELLGGNIWVESVVGEGSTFWFTLKDLSVGAEVEAKYN